MGEDGNSSGRNEDRICMCWMSLVRGVGLKRGDRERVKGLEESTRRAFLVAGIGEWD